jgi:hypothetical protein
MEHNVTMPECYCQSVAARVRFGKVASSRLKSSVKHMNLFKRTPLIIPIFTAILKAASTGAVVFILSTVVMSFAAAGLQAAQTVAAVTVNAQQLGAQIPKDFLGFSNEVTTAGMGLPKPSEQALGKVQKPADVSPDANLVYVLGEPGAPNTDFFTFMSNLGPGVLRLGGNSQDNTCWDPQSAPHPDWCQGAITPGILRLYSTAAAKSGWQIILGLNLKQNSPALALREATEGVAKEIPASRILGFEIGNEPSLFVRTPARPKTYSPDDYVKEALGYIQAFRADPVARRYSFVAPANCCQWNNPESLDTIVKGLASDLKLVSVHNYPTTTCGQRNVTAAELLSPERMERFNALSKKLVGVAHDHSLPISLAETNSASCGGMAGVSDAFASAVWGLDYMFNIARDGYVGIDFHFSYRTGGSAYNPIQTFGWKNGNRERYRNEAEPLYYAMYAFARHAAGEHFLNASIETKSNISAFATVACPTCDVHVFVINKDESASGQVSVHLSGAKGQAMLELLQAPSLGSLAGSVKYAGQQFDTRGHIGRPSTSRVPRGADGDYTFALPNSAAAVLSIHR